MGKAADEKPAATKAALAKSEGPAECGGKVKYRSKVKPAEEKRADEKAALARSVGPTECGGKVKYRAEVKPAEVMPAEEKPADAKPAEAANFCFGLFFSPDGHALHSHPSGTGLAACSMKHAGGQ